MKGYNGTIFAYGQTGSGKTFTVQGGGDDVKHRTSRGLLPRVLEYVLEQCAREERKVNQT